MPTGCLRIHCVGASRAGKAGIRRSGRRRRVRSMRLMPSWPGWRIAGYFQTSSKSWWVAGHSGGAQVVQRYAIAGKGELALTGEGVGVRYVVANPSSYAYFSAERPEPAIAAACPDYNHWKYGMEARPAYLAGSNDRCIGASLRCAKGYLFIGNAGYQSKSFRSRQDMHGRGRGAIPVHARSCLCRHDAGPRRRNAESQSLGRARRRARRRQNADLALRPQSLV